MPTIAFPRSQLASLQELAARVLEARGPNAELETLARDLLAGFFDTCTRAGLDGVLHELAQACALLELADGGMLADEPRLYDELLGRLGNKAEFDPRGPRNAKPGQLAECLSAVLGLTPVDPPDRGLTMPETSRAEVTAAIAGVIDVELAVPRIRETIIATARAACDPRHHKTFDKIAATLDERGMRAPQPQKLPLDAVQAVQRVLAETRTTVVAQAANAAIDRAKAALAAVSPEAAERIDAPVSHRLTPREVAVQRLHDPRLPKAPAAVAQSLFDSLSELAALAFPAPTQVARPYAPATTFVVGELIDHPKFGRGTVKSSALGRIEVEFAEGTHTLIHARAGK